MDQKKKKSIKKKLPSKKKSPVDLTSQIKWGVNTLMTLVNSSPKKKSLIDDGQNIFLQVSLFKIPEVDEMVKRKIVLKHPPYAGKPEVCFIARDCLRKDRIKRMDDEMTDYTVECYEDFFKKQKIVGITSILPYHQLKCEYDTYELRRKLVNQFDVFLCSSSLHSQDNFFTCLGKPFIKKNKFPISVKLPRFKSEFDPKANKAVQAAIASTVFRVRDGSDNYCIKIGNTLNEKKAIKENLKIVLNQIINSEFIPGGFSNLRLISLKSDRSKAVPLYISMDSGRNVPVPYVAPNVPVRESVRGELSTMLRKNVTVLPDGHVFVTPAEGSSDDESGKEDDEDDDEDDEEREFQVNEEEEEKFHRKSGKKSKEVDKKKGKPSREDVSDDDEDIEEDIEAAEQTYLANWNEDMESSEDEQPKEEGTQKRRKGVPNGKSVKKFKKNEAPRMKKEVTSSKKLKKGDTKPKTNSIYGKLGKEKIKVKKNQPEKVESPNSKKKKKMSEAKPSKKGEKKQKKKNMKK